MRRYFSLARVVILPYVRSHKLRVLITLFGISLGVGVFIAVQSASISVRQSMKSLIGVISSGSDLEITLDRGGFSEEVFSIVGAVKGIKQFYPVTVNRTRIKIKDKYVSVFIFGIDVTRRVFSDDVSFSGGVDFDMDSFLSLPGSLLVGKAFLDLHGISSSSDLGLITAKGEIDCKIAGVIGGGDSLYNKSNVIFMDIFASQYLFNKEGLLDRIDIELDSGANLGAVKDALSSLLVGKASVREASGQLVQFGNFYKSFDLNLTVVSFISLLVGIYLIVNTLNTAIFQQRKEIGILRSLGASRLDIVILFLLKGVIIGIVGSLFGVILGYFLAYFSLEAFSSVLHYTLFDDNEFNISLNILLFGFGVGVLISFFASLLPVLSSFRSMPVYNIRTFATQSGSLGSNFKYKVLFYAGIFCLFLSYISSRQDIVFGIPLFGFLSNFLIIISFSLMIPFLLDRKLFFMSVYLRSILTRFRSFFEFYLGMQNAGGVSLGKNAIAAGTLMISVSLIINISILIDSYHHSIENWFYNVNNADVSIVSGSSYSEGDIFPMSEDRLSSLSSMSIYVEDVDYYRFRIVSYRGKLLDLHSFDLDVARRHVNYSFIEGDSESAFRVMEEEDGIFISEDLSSKFNLSIGDLVEFDGFKGASFKVAGIVVNYLSSKGIISMSRDSYKRHFGDSSVDIFKIYLREGVSVDNFRNIFYKELKGADALIFDSLSKFKAKVLSSIDNTFLMFHILSFITVFIAFMGILNTLLSTVIDRRREIGILKSVGASRGQIIRIILSQSVFVGIFSTVLGIISGFLLSFVTVFIINKQTIGWHLEYSFSFLFIFLVFIFFIIISLLAGYYPAYRASLILPREALEYE